MFFTLSLLIKYKILIFNRNKEFSRIFPKPSKVFSNKDLQFVFDILSVFFLLVVFFTFSRFEVPLNVLLLEFEDSPLALTVTLRFIRIRYRRI